MADPSGMGVVSLPKPVGGHVLAHCSTTRLMIRKGKGETRVVKVVDSPNMPEDDATIEICDKGIQNGEA